MIRKIVLAAIICAVIVPSAAYGYRFGVGGYTSLFSHGMEVTFWAPLGERCAWFGGPHGFGVYLFDDDDEDDKGDGFYTIGARTGLMILPSEWISPVIGTGAGYTKRSFTNDESEDYGVRLFTGLSFAPFDPLSEKVNWLTWLSPVRGLRFTFETGVRYQYHYDYHIDYRWNHVLDEDVEYIETEEFAEIYLPDFGFGISYNW